MKGSRVLILGGGISGLSSALVLSPHFEEVTVLERGKYSAGSPAERKNTPQDAHLHVLLARGLEILSSIIPECSDWLDELDLPRGDLTQHVRFSFGGRWLPRVDSGIPVRPCTRPIVESLLVRAVRTKDNIILREDARAHDLLIRRGAVRSIVLSEAGGANQTIEADWIIDARGRSSQLSKWLENHGYGPVEEEVVDAGVTYSSCIFVPETEHDMDWIVMASSPRFPDQPEGAGVMRIGERKWLSALVGYGGLPTPRSTEELRDRIARLYPAPFSERLKETKAESDSIAHYGRIRNRRRLFTKMKDWPDRLSVIGDAACTFNPRYGQGMTLALIAAQTLGTVLESHWARTGSLDGLAHRFQSALDRTFIIPWQMALVEDRLWSHEAQQRTPTIPDKILATLSQRLLNAAFSDIGTYIRFMNVAHLLEPPTHLLTLRTLFKVAAPA